MDNPNPDKVAVVDEVRQRFADSDGALLTEYRGLDVGAMSELRRSLREAGGDYHIYKNTLVRLAVADLDADLGEMLEGPTAIAFVVPGPDGAPGDAAAVAKALKEFAKTNEALVVKGGVLGSSLLSAEQTKALADLPSKEVLLGQFAGMLQAPLTRMARLLNAVPSKFAYGLQALIEAGGAPGAPADPPPEASGETAGDAGGPAADTDAAEAETADVTLPAATEAPADNETDSDAPATEAAADTDAPAIEAAADTDAAAPEAAADTESPTPNENPQES